MKRDRFKVMRGGSWNLTSGWSRSTYRLSRDLYQDRGYQGLRVCFRARQSGESHGKK